MKEWIAVAVLLYSVPLFALLLTWKKPLWQALRGIVLSEVLGILCFFPPVSYTHLFLAGRDAFCYRSPLAGKGCRVAGCRCRYWEGVSPICFRKRLPK